MYCNISLVLPKDFTQRLQPLSFIFPGVLLFLCVLRTDGSLKATLHLLQAAAFIGATLCGINDLHGYAVRFIERV
jgi:hypothetical protein